MANNPKLFIKLTTMNRAFCPGYSLAEEVGRNRPNAQVTAIMPSIELFIGTSIGLSIRLPIELFIYPFIRLSIRRPIIPLLGIVFVGFI